MKKYFLFMMRNFASFMILFFALAMTVHAVSDSDFNNYISHYWTFNNTLSDSSGTLDLSDGGMTTFTECQFGMCLNISEGGYVYNVNPFTMNNDAFTFMCWSYTDGTVMASHPTILGAMDDYDTTGIEYRISYDVTSRFTYNQTYSSLNSPYTYFSGRWLLLGGAFNGTHIYQIFNNDTTLGDILESSASAGYSPYTYFGIRGRDLSSATYYKGLLSNCILLNKTVTQDELNYYYNEGNGRQIMPLPACIENWIGHYSECVNNTQTLIYQDINDCNTTINLPADNGSSVPCYDTLNNSLQSCWDITPQGVLAYNFILHHGIWEFYNRYFLYGSGYTEIAHMNNDVFLRGVDESNNNVSYNIDSQYGYTLALWKHTDGLETPQIGNYSLFFDQSRFQIINEYNDSPIHENKLQFVYHGIFADNPYYMIDRELNSITESPSYYDSIIIVFDKLNSHIKLYFNGTFIENLQFNGSDTVSIDNITDGVLNFGGSPYIPSVSDWENAGTALGGIKIFNKALNDTEVSQISDNYNFNDCNNYLPVTSNNYYVWNPVYSDCSLGSQTKTYALTINNVTCGGQAGKCPINESLPIDNGSIISCSCYITNFSECMNNTHIKTYYTADSCNSGDVYNHVPYDNNTIAQFCDTVNNTLKDKLVWYYDFNNTQPSSVNSLTNGLILNYVNKSTPPIYLSPALSTRSDGVVGNAVQFNPTGIFPYTDLLNMNDYNFNPSNGEDFTISIWYNSVLQPVNKGGYNGRILRLEANNPPYNFIEFGLDMADWQLNKSQPRIRFYNNNAQTCNVPFDTSGSIINTVWHQLVLVRSNLTYYTYVDGVNTNSFTCVTPDLSDTPNYQVGSSVGVINYYAGSKYFDGSVDEYGMWNRSLTSDEVALLYKRIPYSSMEATCVENWIGYHTDCIDGNQTLIYQDNNDCNTTNNLPMDNGTIISCTASQGSGVLQLKNVDTSSTIAFITGFLAFLVILAVLVLLYTNFFGENVDENTMKYINYIAIAVIIVVMIIFLTAIL